MVWKEPTGPLFMPNWEWGGGGYYSAATATAALCGFFVWARQFDVNIALQSPWKNKN